MLSIRPLPLDLAKKASRELNENAFSMASDIEALRNWLTKQPHLIARTDDQFLVTFLRGCKYNMQRAKEKLDSYYTLRSALPKIFSQRNPSDPKFLEQFRLGLTIPSTKHNIDGSSLLFSKLGAYDPQKYHFLDILKSNYMIIDRIFTEDDNFIVSGHTLVVDMEGFNTSHISQITPTIIKNIANLIAGAYPMRHKAIHIINVPYAAEILIKILKSFLSLKLAERIFVHSDLNSLYDYVPRNVLPEEFGGSFGSLSTIIDNYERLYLSNSNWFIEDAKYKCDESKRIISRDNEKVNYGMDGSFRKLEVD